FYGIHTTLATDPKQHPYWMVSFFTEGNISRFVLLDAISGELMTPSTKAFFYSNILNGWVKKDGHTATWSLEEMALHDAFFVLGGRQRVLPEEGDLPQEEALIIAKTALMSTMGLEESALAQLDVSCELVWKYDGDESYENRDRRVWAFTFFKSPQYDLFVYGVDVSAKDGEVLSVYDIHSANG
ncbi:MAG: hypothetical protein GX786_06870, partial [Clostridiales bacterium]|nr:hypothetical protein [Clostridiales bacterium]